MAGFYIHIPFCKKRCAYCDFFSTTNLQLIDDFVNAVTKEIVMQKDYMRNEIINTIYFGGGTPSLLNQNQFIKILDAINSTYKIGKKFEITLEANPDDLNIDYLIDLKKTGFNRLSIGVQSFNDSYLQLMKRRHNSQEALHVIQNAKETGFNNISVDLIYGIPNMLLSDWEKNLDILLNLNIQHISAYHLTIEPKTVFKKLFDNNKIQLPTDEESIAQFKLLLEKTKEHQFIHYEISNFAREGFFSLHNSNYWKNIKYIGVGPSAHSYNLTSRQWNISNLKNYLSEITKGNIPFEIENLSKSDRYNDYIITSLRTMWGINLKTIENDFGKMYFDFIINDVNRFIKKNLLIKNNDNIVLSEEGKILSDQIIRILLYV